MTNPAPGWYPDQANPQRLRWWDGATWTAHTQPNPQAPPAQPPPQTHAPQHALAAHQPAPQAAGVAPQQHQAWQQPMGTMVGSGPLYTAPEILIAQKTKVFGISSNAGAYQIIDPSGTQIGVFKEPDTAAGKVLKQLNPLANFQVKEFELTDANGVVLLKVRNPQGFKATLKPKFEVSTAHGMPIGTIEQQKVFSGLGFVFTVNGQNVGHFEQVRDTGFSRRFVCRDGHNTQIAEFVKRSRGAQSFKELVTQDDSYVLVRPNPIPEPLGSLVLISACALDATFFERT